MPIRFRCPHDDCGVKLSIASRKAGTVVGCPRCSRHIKVPTPRPVTGILIDETPDDPAPSSPPPIEKDWREAPPPAPSPNEPWPDPPAYEPPAQDFDSGYGGADVWGTSRSYYRPRSGMVNLVALIFLLDAALCFACGGVALFGAGFAAIGLHELQAEARAVLGGLASFIACVAIVLGLPSLLTAYGVWFRFYWGRVLGLIMGVLNALWALASAMVFDPCGLTINGIFAAVSLTVLLMPRYAEEFN